MLNQPQPAHILIVEDEMSLASIMHDYLVASGYQCTHVADGAKVMDTFRLVQPDLILLDLMLPNVDGLTLCRALRKETDAPIMIVTAKVDEIDRILGLEVGADDYVCKPFSPREVVARVKASLRRQMRLTTPLLTGLKIDHESFQVTMHGVPIKLTQVEFRLLETLSLAPGRVFSRNQLMDAVYSDHRIVTDRTIDSHIKNLRKKLGEQGEDWIQSIYGVGYRFEDNS
ncbi:response regulator [Vibrio tritonius]|uniref:response regulator n=1 Tax=Vibrio tritonius TaxID=1435069 RepID=UPI0008387FB5|nr:response regulator [Vibrio tritonius]